MKLCGWIHKIMARTISMEATEPSLAKIPVWFYVFCYCNFLPSDRAFPYEEVCNAVVPLHANIRMIIRLDKLAHNRRPNF